MKKILTCVCAILACEHLLSNDGKITMEDAQLESIESLYRTFSSGLLGACAE